MFGLTVAKVSEAMYKNEAERSIDTFFSYPVVVLSFIWMPLAVFFCSLYLMRNVKSSIRIISPLIFALSTLAFCLSITAGWVIRDIGPNFMEGRPSSEEIVQGFWSGVVRMLLLSCSVSAVGLLFWRYEVRESKRDELQREQIRLESIDGMFDTFADLPRLQDDELTDENKGNEGSEIKKALAGKTWKDIVALMTETPFNRSISYLTPAAFSYYLPGYMAGLLKYPDETDLFLVLLTRLTRSKNPQFFEIVRCLNAAQEKTVLLFFQQMQTYYDVDLRTTAIAPAIKEYWGMPDAVRTSFKNASH